jgi:hypothetical protein
MMLINPLKLVLIHIIVNNSGCTSKTTPHFTITKINWLMLFKEIIAIYNVKHIKSINTKSVVTDCEPGSSVSIVSGYGMDEQAIEVRSPAEAKGFFL